jgi:uncharacterized protein YydD (DUF2326 family)
LKEVNKDLKSHFKALQEKVARLSDMQELQVSYGEKENTRYLGESTMKR